MTARRHFFARTRERLLAREFGQRRFALLDVGAGNNSPSRIKSVFPNCEYHGLDRDTSYNLDAQSLACADRFYTLDLTECRFELLPDEYYDALILSHVIEHLFNGERVLTLLAQKIKKGGVVYIEWPSFRSLFLLSMRGTLNFCDDPTHVRFYRREELAHVLENAGCSVERMGRCRSLLRCMVWPLIVLMDSRQRGYVDGSDLWELVGFADFIWARKTG